VKSINLEETPGDLEVSDASTMLSQV